MSQRRAFRLTPCTVVSSPVPLVARRVDLRYFAEMPWIAVPFSDARRRRALGQRLGVRGIPALATIAPDGTIINHSARTAAEQDSKVGPG